jgi:glycosyltransferase involved in cell wall biosynthesis
VLAAVHDVAVPPFPEAERHRVRVIPNAIEPIDMPADRRRHLRAKARSAWGIPDDRPVLGFMGRTSWEKRPDRLIDAIESLPGWTGVMVGPYQESIRPVVESRGLADRVHLVGATAETSATLLAFDCLLVPSNEEGFCYSGLEAIELEVPVVMTSVGFAADRPDLVTRIPHTADGPTIAEAVRAAMVDRAKLAVARAAAREAFSFERFARGWTQAIQDAVPNRKTLRKVVALPPTAR